MQRLQGIAVSPGVAIGEALVMSNEGFRIPRRFVLRDAVEDELERFGKAIDATGAEMEKNRDAIARELGDQYAAIFSAHLQMLRDPVLRNEIEEMIRDRHYSPEYAVSRALRRYVKVFEQLENSYLSQRASDITDIEKRLLRNLLGLRREELSQLTSPVLVLARDLTPSETANLDRRFVQGFVTEIGGPGSHTAIVAEALAIPAVVGTGPFLSEVSGGDLVIIDGDMGQVIVRPDEETIARYRHEIEQHVHLATKLESLRDLPAETADKVQVQLLGNIEFPYEVEICRDRGSDGVGLYRTEFLYLGASEEPTEEVHYEAYTAVVQAMHPNPVVIRTLDLGADKLTAMPHPEDERNPFLGLRSIRLSLRNIELFRTQLRAVLRASAHGDVRVMFPMVSTIHEFRQAKMILADVMEDLEETGQPFSRDIPVGMMVEVPAAVIMIDRFLDEADFISIGTNDLVQYTLAVDRSNKDVAYLYTSADPAVIRLLATAIEQADAKGIPVTVCGQMSGNPIYTMLLLGLGLRRFSVTPIAIPEIKKICRSVTIEQCRELAAHIKTLDSAEVIKRFLQSRSEEGLLGVIRLMAHQRIQLRFRKEGDLRYLGHRDILRTFERLFRRAGLNMRQTQGFHPRAKMSFPLALSVGIAGEDEVVEIELEEPMSIDEITDRVRRQCPAGLDFHSGCELPTGTKNAPVESVVLQLEIPAERQDALQERINELMAVESREIKREGRAAPINLRPLVESLSIEEGRLRAKMLISSQVSARPRELLAELGIDDLESLGFPLARTHALS